ncbi:IS1 family transposase [Shigella flexneri]
MSALKWTNIGATSVLITSALAVYAYDRIRRTVVAHVFGERTLATLERLRACCRPLRSWYG